MMHFPCLHCTGSACLDDTEGSGSVSRMIFKNFLVFYFFSKNQMITLFLFPEIVGRCCSALGIATHKLLVRPRYYWKGLQKSHTSDDIGQRYQLHSLSIQLFNFLELLNTLSHSKYPSFPSTIILLI